MERCGEHTVVGPLEDRDQPALALLGPSGKHGVRQQWRQGDGDQEGAEHGEDKGPRHGTEHLALDALEGEHRDEDHQNDAHPEHHGSGHLLGGLDDAGEPLGGGEWPTEPLLPPGQRTHVAFGDHHRAVDDDAEIDGAEAEQAGGDGKLVHSEHGKDHGQRDGGGDDEPGTKPAEQEEQDDDDECRAENEVVGDRPEDRSHELRAVIDGGEHDIVGQRTADGVESFAERLGDDLAVLTHQHESETQDDLALTRGGDRPAADLVAEGDLRHIPDEHRGPLARLDHDV